MKHLVRLIIYCSIFALPVMTHAQNPDPRDYEVGYFVPNHTTIINTYLRQVSATEGRDYSAQALALRATHIMKFGDLVITPFDLIVPVQNTDLYTPVAALAAVNPAFATVPTDFKLNSHTSGLGDITYLPTIGHGIEQSKEDRTHTWYALTLYVTAPTGRYDKNKLLNVGSNRWTINPLVVVGQRFWKAFTFEAMANMAFYTNNSEYRTLATGPRDFSLSQKPSFGAAAQFAVDLHPMFYVGLSYYLAINGKRTRDVGDGIDQFDADSSTVHTLRTNLGIRVTPQTLILAQWNEDVGGSSNAVKGRFFGLRLTHAFFAAPAPSPRAPITDPNAAPTAPASAAN
ncbi:MAG: hypothetical protein RL701_2347 [Pseudomonadota bacterium]